MQDKLIKLSNEDLVRTNGYTYEQLYNMYITENYSLELVARVISVEMALLSRIFWKYGLPDEKRKINPSFLYEKRFLPENKNVVRTSGVAVRIPSKSSEDAFLDELA